MHKTLARKAIEKLREFSEADKLVLFGSVARGHYSPTADIDIAFICDEGLRWFPLDDNNVPAGLIIKINAALSDIKNNKHIKFHVPVYWASEFEAGIELYSGRKLPADLLHKVGRVVYNAERALV